MVQKQVDLINSAIASKVANLIGVAPFDAFALTSIGPLLNHARQRGGGKWRPWRTPLRAGSANDAFATSCGKR